jgi:hypothetical protein
VSIDTDFDGEKCFPRIEAARRTVSGQEKDRTAAIQAWIAECEGTGISVTALMRSAYRDGWSDALAAPIPATEPKDAE